MRPPASPLSPSPVCLVLLSNVGIGILESVKNAASPLQSTFPFQSPPARQPVNSAKRIYFLEVVPAA